MTTFIKAGFWEKLCAKCTGYKGWLNLDEFVNSRVVPGPQGPQGIQGIQGPQGSPNGLFSQTGNSVPVTGTNVESSIINGGVGTLSVPSNGFQIGDSFKADFGGVMSAANNQTIRIKVKAGSIVLLDSGVQNLSPSKAKKLSKAEQIKELSWAYHENCYNCHKAVKAVNKKANAPKSCGKCHKKIKK